MILFLRKNYVISSRRNFYSNKEFSSLEKKSKKGDFNYTRNLRPK